MGCCHSFGPTKPSPSRPFFARAGLSPSRPASRRFSQPIKPSRRFLGQIELA